MTSIFNKLNLKDQAEILVINAPTSFEPELAELVGVAVQRDPHAVENVQFCLAFVTRQAEVDELARLLGAKAKGDVLLWFAYPKGSSKRYQCEFNRDTGWQALGELDFEPVRQVAIDEDWSALRFRRAAYIKKMTRSTLQAISKTGQSKLEKNSGGMMNDDLLVLPPGGSGPGILVLHAWWGLNDFMRGFCQRLASEGYVVLAPDLYHGRTAATIEQADQLSSTLRRKEVEAEISAAAQKLAGLEQVQQPKIGLVGFSLGAFWGLWLSVEQAALVGAAAVFYGNRGLDYSQAQAAYLCHFAETDPFEAASGVKKLERSLRKAQRPAAIYTYPGTGHWFFESDRPDAYQPEAAELAWQRTLAFFKEYLPV